MSPRGEEKEKRHVKSVRMDGERRVAGVGALYVSLFFSPRRLATSVSFFSRRMRVARSWVGVGSLSSSVSP